MAIRVPQTLLLLLLSLSVELGPQTTCIHPVPSYAVVSIFFQLQPAAEARHFLFRDSFYRYYWVAVFLQGLLISTVKVRDAFITSPESVLVQASSIFVFSVAQTLALRQFLPRCMECRRGLAITAVRLSVRPSNS